MKSGEPSWLVVCSLRDVHREMVYDRAMHEIFPHHDLRRFVEILPRLCFRNMDMEYSYAVAPYCVESDAQLMFWIPMDHGIRDSLEAGSLTITISTPPTPQQALRALLLVAPLLETQHLVRPPGRRNLLNADAV
ncbi:hypothetical protein Emag_007902 [Eimeria magna]